MFLITSLKCFGNYVFLTYEINIGLWYCNTTPQLNLFTHPIIQVYTIPAGGCIIRCQNQEEKSSMFNGSIISSLYYFKTDSSYPLTN